MITEEVLAKYRQLGGDLDGLGRWAGPQPSDPTFERSLYELDRLLQQAMMVTLGIVDDAFAEHVRREVERATASAEIAAEIWELARQ